MTPLEFVKYLGFSPTDPFWTFHIIWSTIPPKNWIVARNKLQPQDTTLVLNLNNSYWMLDLCRRDHLFTTQWREYGISVDSQQLRYRHRMRWPAISSPMEVVSAISELEKLLEIRFVEEVDFYGTLSLLLKNEDFNQKPLTSWLQRRV
ncbi:MAG TPA: hypothetical protein VN030_09055 [Cellvibrio sp.]|nr:hypothetical protein [Cellvibrio sp.]